MLHVVVRIGSRAFRELLASGIAWCRGCVPRRLTPNEEAFAEQNRLFWQSYAAPTPAKAGLTYVLVEPQAHPIIALCNASFAAIAAHAKDAIPLFALPSRRDVCRHVLASYPHSTFVSLDNWRYLLARIVTAVHAARVYRRLTSPEDILELTDEGQRYGDIIYDGVLGMGYATVRQVDGRVFEALCEYFWSRYVIGDILARYRIVAYVTHAIGITNATFARQVLRQNVEVLNRIGASEIQLCRWRRADDVGRFPFKPERRYFDHVMTTHRETVVRLAEEYLGARQSQQVTNVAVELAFDRRKRLFSSREELMTELGMEPRKKTVFVMMHIFNDFPHTQVTRRMLFKDYYEWFQKTLEIARSVPEVNWVFREHPAAEFYPTKDVDVDAEFEREKLIRFMGRRADFNARSIRDVADAIVTCAGTAGLEYACYGIPCILAGEATYSGFGFAIEPLSAGEYAKELRRVHQIGRLSAEQTEAAKVALWLQFVLLPGVAYLFCPRYEYRETLGISPDRVWKDAAELFAGGDHAEMRRQAAALAAFVRDRSWTQYVDGERQGLMRGALSGITE